MGETFQKAVAQVNLDPVDMDEARYLLSLFSAVMEYFPGGIILTDKKLNVLICNNELKRLMEFPASMFEYRAPTLPEIFRFNAIRGEYGPGNPEELVAEKMLLVEKRIAHCYERTRPDGRVLEIRGTPITGSGFITSYTDVTERARRQKQILLRATRDSLTGLLNRSSLQEEFNHFVARARRGEGFALIYLDLDNFKQFNDTHGHRIGDAVIAEISSRITSTIRETDICARIGGDEFVILQASVETLLDILSLVERLTARLNLPFIYEGLTLPLGASIGVCSSLTSPDNLDLETMIGWADSEMYRVKKRAKGGFSIHGCKAAAASCSFHQCGCFPGQQVYGDSGQQSKLGVWPDDRFDASLENTPLGLASLLRIET
jgi:diguanylate cyclase (GGDEF)-like protein